MWLAIVEKKEEFEALSKAFLREDKKAYVKKDSPFGSPILMAQESEIINLPSFVLLDGDVDHNREALRWCYKNLNVDAFVSTGVIGIFDTEKRADAPLVFCPLECIRSAGRMDLYSGPLLYENLPFDSGFQGELRNLLEGLQENFLATPRLFSGQHDVEGESLEALLSSQLACLGFDCFSGDLLLFCRALSVPCACLKLAVDPKETNGSNSVQELSRLWLRLFEAKLKEESLK